MSSSNGPLGTHRPFLVVPARFFKKKKGVHMPHAFWQARLGAALTCLQAVIQAQKKRVASKRRFATLACARPGLVVLPILLDPLAPVVLVPPLPLAPLRVPVIPPLPLATAAFGCPAPIAPFLACRKLLDFPCLKGGPSKSGGDLANPRVPSNKDWF